MTDKEMLKLELWEDGFLLHESHFEYQNKLEDMIRTLLFSEKNCINDELQHKALNLLGKNKNNTT